MQVQVGPPWMIIMVNQEVMMTTMIRVPGDPVGGPCGPSRCRSHHWPSGPQGPIGPVASVFNNLHVKCPIFSTKVNVNAESHLFHSSD